MPVDCLACGRANNERLSACLYCGEGLPEVERVEEPAVEPAPGAGAPVRDVPRPSLLVLSPPECSPQEVATSGRISPTRIAVVSEALGLDPYLARKVLSTCYPSVIARDEPAKLVEIARRLAAAELELSRLAPEDLDAMGEAFRAVALEVPAPGSGAVLRFVSEDGGHVDVAAGSVQLMVRADIKVEWVGPRPEGRRASAIGKAGPELEQLERVRSDFPALEVQAAGTPRIRLHLAHFDFSGLGAAAVPSALLNLNHIVALLARANRGVRVDEAFRFVPHETDPLDGVFGAYSSNEHQFDRYTRVIGAHWRKLAGA